MGFQEKAQELGMRVVKSYTFSSSSNDGYQEILDEIKLSEIRAIYLTIGALDVLQQNFFNYTHSIGAIGKGWIYVLGSEELSPDVDYSTIDGLISVTAAKNTSMRMYLDYSECISTHINQKFGPFANLTLPPEHIFKVGTLDRIWEATYLLAHVIHSIGAENVDDIDMLNQAIRSQNAESFNGPLTLNEFGDRVGAKSNVINLKNNAKEIVGTIDIATNTLKLDEPIIYMGNLTQRPPYYIKSCSKMDNFFINVSDCFPKRNITYTPKDEETQEYCQLPNEEIISCDYVHYEEANFPIIIASFSMIMSGLLGFGIIYNWNHPVLKLGQQKFLLLMVFGGMIVLIVPLIYIGKPNPLKCNAEVALLSIGLCFLFGPLHLKSWRVHVLFNGKVKKSKIQDKDLLKRLFVFVLLNIVIIAIVFMVSPLYIATEMKLLENGVRVPFQFCTAGDSPFFTVLSTFHATTLLYGMYLAFLVRNVEIDVFAVEVKWVFFSVYNGGIFMICTVALLQGITFTAHETLILLVVAIAIGVPGTLGLLIIPKFVMIYNGFDVQQALQKKQYTTTTKTTTKGQNSRVNSKSLTSSKTSNQVSPTENALK